MTHDRVAAAVAELADALREQLRAELAARRDDPPTLLDVPSAASALGVSRTTAYNLIASGQLRTVKVGRRRLVPRSAVEGFAR